jgi:hypothetical protein
MLVIAIPLLVFLLGVLLLALATKPVFVELGKACLWVGLFFTVAAVSGKPFRLGT